MSLHEFRDKETVERKNSVKSYFGSEAHESFRSQRIFNGPESLALAIKEGIKESLESKRYEHTINAVLER